MQSQNNVATHPTVGNPVQEMAYRVNKLYASHTFKILN